MFALKNLLALILLNGIGISCGLAETGKKSSAGPEAQQRGPFAPIAGQWQTSIQHPDYGLIVVSAKLRSTGSVYYIALVRGLQFSGFATLTSWDGQTLAGKVEGRRYQAPARIEGNEARVEVPGFGEVRLVRETR